MDVPGKWWQNDALAAAPRGAKRHWAHGTWRVSTWAPSAVRVRGGYVAAYVAPAAARYAIGYAICRTPVRPCRRQSRGPLLATGGRVSGPGGPDGFVDARGRLRVACAAW